MHICRPRNLLVNEDCHIKIADFGLARLYDETNNTRITVMTEYVTTRWYRAPEIIVGWPTYSNAVDMWAVGCILAELLGRTPLFPGTDSSHQLVLIANKLGRPSMSFIEAARKLAYKDYLFNMEQENCLISSLATAHSTADPIALDLLSQLLTWDPTERLSAHRALRHPYLHSLASILESQSTTDPTHSTNEYTTSSPNTAPRTPTHANMSQHKLGTAYDTCNDSHGQDTFICCQQLSSCTGSPGEKKSHKSKTNGPTRPDSLLLSIEGF